MSHGPTVAAFMHVHCVTLSGVEVCSYHVTVSAQPAVVSWIVCRNTFVYGEDADEHQPKAALESDEATLR